MRRKGFAKAFLVLSMALDAPLSCRGEGSYPVTVKQADACVHSAPDEHGYVGTARRDGNDLVVPVVTVEACHLSPKSPEAHVSGSKLSLFWAWSGLGAECLCAHHLEFRISNLPPGEFVVAAPIK